MGAAKGSSTAVELDVDGRTVRISHPERIYFPALGVTKLDLARYYMAVGDGIVRALRDRPCMLHRFPDGLAGDKVHQKRLPRGAPDWVQTVRVHFPRYNRDADELCVTHLADVVWAVQMSTVEFHPWNSRRADVEKPDEWRIDLDRCPNATSGKCAVSRRWCTRCSTNWVRWGGRKPRVGTGCTSTFESSRNGDSTMSAGLHWLSHVKSSGARRGTSPPRGGVRTGSRCRVRRLQPECPRPHDRERILGARCSGGTVSAPVRWNEIDDLEPRDFTIETVPDRFAKLGDLYAGIDDDAFSLDRLLDWADRDERNSPEGDGSQ